MKKTITQAQRNKNSRVFAPNSILRQFFPEILKYLNQYIMGFLSKIWQNWYKNPQESTQNSREYLQKHQCYGKSTTLNLPENRPKKPKVMNVSCFTFGNGFPRRLQPYLFTWPNRWGDIAENLNEPWLLAYHSLFFDILKKTQGPKNSKLKKKLNNSRKKLKVWASLKEIVFIRLNHSNKHTSLGRPFHNVV